MIGLNANSLLSIAIAKEAARDTASTATAAAQETNQAEPSANINITLSNTGRSLSANASQKSKNSDIDDTDLPDAIKQTLKLIREIRAKLEKKLQELQTTLADQRLNPEQRKLRVMALQSEVDALTGSLTAASAMLVQLMNDLKLSDEQKMTASMLSMS